MAIIISFNGTNYLFEESALAPIKNDLKNHLVSNMSGTGASITLDGVVYSVDSAKLATAKNALSNHFTTIVGEGVKVTLNGTEYNLDSSKLSNAINGLQDSFTNLTNNEKVLLEEITLDFSYDNFFEYYSSLIENRTFSFVEGEKYKITWDGVDYIKTAFTFTGDGTDCVGVGNPAAAGLEPNEDPFVIFSVNENLNLFFIALDEAPTHTIKISKMASTSAKSFGGLYQPGTIVSYSGSQDKESIADKQIISWEDLIASGAIRVENGVVYGNANMETNENASSDILCGDLIFPDDGSVTAIAGQVINESVVETPAFAHCSNLTGVFTPLTIKRIGDQAFGGCTNLNIAGIFAEDIGMMAFAMCDKLAHIGISNKVTKIKDSTFMLCTSLSNITIPVSVTSIEPWAFYSCSNLKNIYYKGTESQWAAIEKGTAWDGNMPEDYTIHYNS
jgi:hypothetical protein